MHECPICKGILRKLGRLGCLLWLRCEACGIEVSHRLKVEYGREEESFDEAEDWF